MVFEKLNRLFIRQRKKIVVACCFALVLAAGVPNVRNHVRRNATEDLNQVLTILSMSDVSQADEYKGLLSQADAELQRLLAEGYSKEYLEHASLALSNYKEAFECYQKDKVSQKVTDVSDSMKGFVFTADEVYGPQGKMVYSKQHGDRLAALGKEYSKEFDLR